MNSKDRRAHLVFVTESPWEAIRKRAAEKLKQGGQAALEEAATLVGDADFQNKVPENDSFPLHLWDHFRKSSHPIGWLPPRRTPEERSVPVWELRSNGTGGMGLPARPRSQALPQGPAAALVQDATADPDSAAAFESILQNSNGRFEAALFRPTAPTAANRSLATSLAQAFAPLTPKHPNQPAASGTVPLESVTLELLNIAINGGAYDSGQGAALGRLHAWRTIRWMVTGHRDAPFKEVLDLARSTQWIRFDPQALPWFEDVAWDGCCAACTPHRVSIVAWTDTD